MAIWRVRIAEGERLARGSVEAGADRAARCRRRVGAPQQCQHAGAAPGSKGLPDVQVPAGVPVAGSRPLRACYA
jgi:hypothetical protein